VSEFSDNLSLAWSTSARVFGDVLTFFGSATEYDVVIHRLDFSTEVEGGAPGRKAVLAGEVVMKLSDWVAAGGAKGARVVVGGADARVLNDPDVGFTADTVTLVLGPRT
jgi:hypothetical protein